MDYEEKNYTKEELVEKVNEFKRIFMEMAKERAEKEGPGSLIRPTVVGAERFLDTDAGRLRVLTYGLENSERQPLFLNIHGGGFVLGGPEMEDPFMMNLAENAGVKILNIEYSLAPEAMFPQALDECYAVVKYAQTHPDELGIDPERIAVGGHSAGGNFSAALCLKNAETNELNIKCAILDYPPLDIYTPAHLKPKGKGMEAEVYLNPEITHIFDASYCNDKELRKSPLVSPVFASREQLSKFPPTLLITAGLDPLLHEGEVFHDRLVDAGVPVTYQCFEDSPHGFTLSDRPDAREGWRLMIDFLTKWL